MRAESQAARYIPDTPIAKLAQWLAVPVEPARFPRAQLRWRNARWDRAVGLDGLDEQQWLAHFARFEPLEGNLPKPLALKY
ncbi:MAG TPA: selenoprotein O, partial [Novosphingobium sp.]|nr:selenoprotein O [Novosphingobium sp.]